MKFSNKKLCILSLMIVLVLIFTACSDSESKVTSKEKEAEDSIIISGIEDSDIQIKLDEIKDLEAITRDVISIDSNGDKKEYTVTGALFDEVLKKYGKSQKDITVIRLIAGDGYSIEVPNEVLKNRELILAYEINGEPLDEKTQPLRAVVPDERAMYWVRNLLQIEVIKNVEKTEISKVVFLETAVENIEQHDYTYYESVDKAVKVNELISTFEEISDDKTVYLKASDGLEKNETSEIFTSGYIKVTGKETPLFLLPDLPKGMHVKEMLLFTYGKTAFFSFENGLKVFELCGEKQGISLKDIINETGLTQGEKYLFEALDGYTVEIDEADIEKGIVYKRTMGGYAVYFEGLGKNTTVKQLLSFEVIK